MKKLYYLVGLVLGLIILGLISQPVQAAVTVSTASELADAITATASGGDKTILVADGTYTLTDMRT